MYNKETVMFYSACICISLCVHVSCVCVCVCVCVFCHNICFNIICSMYIILSCPPPYNRTGGGVVGLWWDLNVAQGRISVWKQLYTRRR